MKANGPPGDWQGLGSGHQAPAAAARGPTEDRVISSLDALCLTACPGPAAKTRALGEGEMGNRVGTYMNGASPETHTEHCKSCAHFTGQQTEALQNVGLAEGIALI